MKRIYVGLLCTIVSVINVCAQNIVSNLFIPKQQFQQSVSRAVNAYNAFDINYTVLSSLSQTRPQTFQLQLPFEGKTMTIDFKQVKITSDNFSVVTSDDDKDVSLYKKANVELGVFYSGKIQGQTKSIATIAIFNDQVMGVFSDEISNINLGALEYNGNPTSEYILYRESELKSKNPFVCHTPETPIGSIDNQVKEAVQQKTTAVGQPIEIYFECDYALYQSRSSNIANVINYVLGFFNNTAALYEAENVKVQVSQIKVWTTSDPYVTYATTGTLLPIFAADMNSTSYVGDFAHFLSTRNLGGGVAYLLGNPCSSGKNLKTAVSGITTTYSSVPTYSWTVEVVTHELGHNFGSNHTQWCGWVGGALDNCYTTETGCNPGPQPTNGGTIMSYCHLVSTGINFANGFGTQPGNRIRTVISNASCYGNCKMTISMTGTNIGCGNPIGQATVTPTNGTGLYTYLWSNGQTTQTASNLAVGTYYVSVKDAAGCEVMTNVVITSTAGLTPNVTANGNTDMCTGGSVELVTEANSAHTYQWYRGGGSIAGATSNTYTATVAGIYSVRVTSLTCVGQSASINVTITPNPIVTVTPSVSSIKKFSSQTFNAIGADSYNWTSLPFFTTAVTSNTATFTPLQTTTYNIVGTTAIGGCTGSAQAIINVIGCGDVKDTVAKVYSPSRVTVKWTNPAEVTADSFYYRISGTTNAWTGVYVVADSIELIGLIPNTKYDYYITTICASARGEYIASPTGSFTTQALTEDVYIKVYPNPLQANSKIEIILKEASKTTISIVNHLGQRLAVIADNQALPMGQTLLPISLTSQPHGTYFLSVIVNGKKYIKQMTK